jgi:hypothetical protein
LPDRPFSNGRPRTRPGGFRETRSLIVISVVQPAAHSAARSARHDVQEAAGHRDPGTTKLYDRRGYNPKNAASFFATY